MHNATNLSDADTARETLRDLLPVDGTVHVIIRSVSRSGLLRRMDLYAIRGGEAILINGLLREAFGWKLDRNGHVPVDGTGMDMAANVTHHVGWALYGDGYALSHRLL